MMLGGQGPAEAEPEYAQMTEPEYPLSTALAEPEYPQSTALAEPEYPQSTALAEPEYAQGPAEAEPGDAGPGADETKVIVEEEALARGEGDLASGKKEVVSGEEQMVFSNEEPVCEEGYLACGEDDSVFAEGESIWGEKLIIGRAHEPVYSAPAEQQEECAAVAPAVPCVQAAACTAPCPLLDLPAAPNPHLDLPAGIEAATRGKHEGCSPSKDDEGEFDWVASAPELGPTHDAARTPRASIPPLPAPDNRMWCGWEAARTPPRERKPILNSAARAASPLRLGTEKAEGPAGWRGERRVHWAPGAALCQVREYKVEPAQEEEWHAEWQAWFQQRSRRRRRGAAADGGWAAGGCAPGEAAEALLCDEELEEECEDDGNTATGLGVPWLPGMVASPLRSAMRQTLCHARQAADEPPRLPAACTAFTTRHVSRLSARAQLSVTRPQQPSGGCSKALPSRGQLMRRMLRDSAGGQESWDGSPTCS
jgi:hypothetical protein